MAEPLESTPNRLFVAIALPESIRAAVQELQAACRTELAQLPLRWTRPAHFHLTLRFLGDVQTNRLPELRSALIQSCHGIGPLKLHCQGAGLFPARGRPRVVWVGLHDEEGRLVRLFEAVTQATNPFTCESPEETFVGHVTLARCKGINRKGAELLERVTARNVSQHLGTWVVNEILLMRSELLPDGPRYSIIETLWLAGA